ncbi:MAG: PcfJ domain-containing protein [Candidatus Thorarchaeota archaeon]|jgi:hypothetical protein
MATKNKQKKEKRRVKAENKKLHNTCDIDEHIKNLGLSDHREYKNWCRQHNFRADIYKKQADCKKELLVVSRQKIDKVMRQDKKKNRSVKKNIAAYFKGNETTKEFVPNPVLSIHYCGTSKYASDKDKMKLDFITHVNNNSKVFDAEDLPFENGQGHDFRNIPKVVCSLTDYANHFVRPIDTWKPKTHNIKRQLSSLFRHLFALYDVPLFLDKVWLTHYTAQRKLFIMAGKGENVRDPINKTMKPPCRYSKKNTHHFLQSPDNYTIKEALRYGQIMPLGGDRRLVDTVCASRIMERSENEFWESVIRYFVQHPMLDRNQLGPIVDYIIYQKYPLMAGRRVEAEAPQPNFSMRRRDPMTLLREVENWHAQIVKSTRRKALTWKRSETIVPLSLEQGDGANSRLWAINELISTRELVSEGKTMSHCVGSYDHSCFSGRCTIWSMKSYQKGKTVDELTLEISNNVIRQARGKRNTMPNQQQKLILKQWAQKNGLGLGRYL